MTTAHTENPVLGERYWFINKMRVMYGEMVREGSDRWLGRNAIMFATVKQGRVIHYPTYWANIGEIFFTEEAAMRCLAEKIERLVKNTARQQRDRKKLLAHLLHRLETGSRTPIDAVTVPPNWVLQLDIPLRDPFFWTMGVRALNCLNNRGDIYFLGDLVQMTKADLLQSRNMGKKSVAKVEEFLAACGLTLNMDVGDWTPPEEES